MNVQGSYLHAKVLGSRQVAKSKANVNSCKVLPPRIIAMLKLGSCWCFWQHKDKSKTLKTPPKSGMTWSLEKHWMNINKIPLKNDSDVTSIHIAKFIGSLILIRLMNDVSQSLKKYTILIWGVPKMVVPNNHGFSLLKMIILGCFGGTTI